MDISFPNLVKFDSGVRRCHAAHASSPSSLVVFCTVRAITHFPKMFRLPAAPFLYSAADDRDATGSLSYLMRERWSTDVDEVWHFDIKTGV